jgi:hypothetical protein
MNQQNGVNQSPVYFKVTPEFKSKATAVLTTKKFSAVYPYMNLINREGFIYTEQELNSVLNFVGEFAYNEVAEFFQGLSKQVSEVSQTEIDEASTEPSSEISETVSEVEQA